MKRYLLPLVALAAIPARASYDPATGAIVNERWKSGVPLGGLGCGKVEAFTDGSFGRATINHNWDRPTGVLNGAYATLTVGSVTRALRLASTNPGIPAGVEKVVYTGNLPAANLSFYDPELPVKASLKAWSSLIPNNAKDSALPVAHLDYAITNPTKAPVDAKLTVRWPNILGFGGRRGGAEWNPTSGNFQKPAVAGPLAGLRFGTTRKYLTPQQNVVGEYFLGAPASVGAVSVQPLAGSVTVSIRIPAGQRRAVPFLLVWAMPNHVVAHRSVIGYTQPKRNDADVAKAVDGDLATRWTTGRYMLPNDALEIALPHAFALGKLTLDSSESKNDWPHGFRVDVGLNGKTRSASRASESAAGTLQKNGVLTIDLRGHTANSIRITNLGASDSYYWSIHELRLTDAGGTAIPLAASNLHAYLSSPITRDTGLKNLGHFWQRDFAGALDIARYAWLAAPRLWAETSEWQKAIAQSNLPTWFSRQMVNAAFPAFANTILTKDGRFSVLESPVDMGGALGTMDQRMAAHALWIQFFSEQDREELDLYARAQDMTPQRDGRITHFVGNVHESLGDPNVGYGVTDWPDLAASWIMQVLKTYRWTNDRAFLMRNLPHIEKAVAFLKAADHDGDGIPEGGSTYDYEHLPRGAFIYSASCTLGALRAAAAAERHAGRLKMAAAYDKQLAALQVATMKTLWNGHGFRKWAATNGSKVENTFVASLAGDWLAQLSGLRRTLPRQTVDTTIKSLLIRHLWAFAPVPPMEVKPDGTLFTSSCFVIQHQPYLGDEAIYEGYADDGMEVQRRVYEITWLQNRNPWGESLSYTAPTGEQGGLVDYMTCPATWHTLNALTGTSLDLPNRTFYVSPHIPESMGGLHVPVFFPTFWARVDANPDKKKLTVTVLKTFGTTASIALLKGDVDNLPIRLERPLPVTAGARWDLSAYWDRLVLPTRESLRGRSMAAK
ncbi:MAG TPA: GH116 family glycosyl-hydrolase [Armatimonadota bacterium]|jgi:uncharacterized protein (DUF608 family)